LERSVEQARIASDAAVKIELPIVFLDAMGLIIPPPLVVDELDYSIPVTETAPPNNARIILTFKNYGRTPARADRYWVERHVGTSLPEKPVFSNFLSFTTGSVIEREGGTLTIDPPPILYLTEAQRDDIAKGIGQLWVYGFVSFLDFQDRRHTRRFCGQWWGVDPGVTTDIGPGFFDAGPENYRDGD
jgi:hypothetical protein